QDFADGGLLMERFAGFVEQPHVLDRDRRLIGEGLEEPYLFVGERPDLLSAEHDCAEAMSLAQQRNREHGAGTACLLELSANGIFIAGMKVVDVHSDAIEHRPA